MKKTLEERISSATSLADVLYIVKEKTMLDTNVSTLARVSEIKQKFNGIFGLCTVRPFPLDPDRDEYSLQAYYFDETFDSLEINSTVLIVFTNRNFISNLQVIDNRSRQTFDNNLHSQKYAVIVSLTKGGGEKGEKGDKGDKGDKGEPGPKGDKGDPGTIDIQTILNKIYPVGSIYMSTQNISPASFLGGNWTSIEGKFLFSKDSSHTAGSVGGYKDAAVITHTHGIPALSGTAQANGSHIHSIGMHLHSGDNSGVTIARGGSNGWVQVSPTDQIWTEYSPNHYHDVVTNSSNTGGASGEVSGTDRNMPPYLVVYMWKRVADN